VDDKRILWLFLLPAHGHRRDTSVRIWHTRDPFRPVSERVTSRGANCLTWLPHGLACLAGELLSLSLYIQISQALAAD
jgi:WD40 repeat protein